MEKNQLFIHPTNECRLGCSFCNYADTRFKGAGCGALDLTKGHANTSMGNLIAGAEHTAFSGGGEPFLNIQAILDAIRSSSHKKFMITTGLGISLSEMGEHLDAVNAACKERASLCVLRISVDSFHGTLDFRGAPGKVLDWFLERRWSHVRVCFIRGTVAEGEVLLKRLHMHCLKKLLPYYHKRVNDFTHVFIIKGRFFQVLLRPTINPSEEARLREDSLMGYVDKIMAIDSQPIYLGKPRSCRGCKGCGTWKSEMANGLDVTVDAMGDVYLYGAELAPLWNIYAEEVTYDLLNQRAGDINELRILQSLDLRVVMTHLERDPILGNLVSQVNYPFAVIRECMKHDRAALYQAIRNLAEVG